MTMRMNAHPKVLMNMLLESPNVCDGAGRTILCISTCHGLARTKALRMEESHLKRFLLSVQISACRPYQWCGVQVPPDYLAAAGRHSATSGTGACVRLLVEDFEEDIDLEAEVDRLLSGLGGIDPTSIDLVVDLEDLGPEANRAVLVARSVFSMIPQKDQWRRMILAAASFPEDLSDLGAATTSTIPRREWELWKTLQRRPNILPRRDLIFGDYAIAHPVPKELDPRIMQMSASIRYTTPDDWLVVKGRNVRQYGFDQYFELCKTLIGGPEYSGRDFSWGDRYIDDCANGMTGPGNATTWRKVGTNHHLTLVTRELAKLRPGA